MIDTIKTWKERKGLLNSEPFRAFIGVEWEMQAEIDALRAALKQPSGKCPIADHMRMANESLRQASEHSYKIAMATRTLAPKEDV